MCVSIIKSYRLLFLNLTLVVALWTSKGNISQSFIPLTFELVEKYSSYVLVRFALN